MNLDGPTSRVRLDNPITAWFAGGPLDGQHTTCDLEEHNWTHQGTEYYRITDGRFAPRLISIFVARKQTPEEKNQTIDRVTIKALQSAAPKINF